MDPVKKTEPLQQVDPVKTEPLQQVDPERRLNHFSKVDPVKKTELLQQVDPVEKTRRHSDGT